jgi:hypothetical protein
MTFGPAHIVMPAKAGIDDLQADQPAKAYWL